MHDLTISLLTPGPWGQPFHSPFGFFQHIINLKFEGFFIHLMLVVLAHNHSHVRLLLHCFTSIIGPLAFVRVILTCYD